MADRRTRRGDSIPTVLRSILDDAQIPLPNEVMRTLATGRLERTISSEQLARVIAYERENFLRTRMPPLLCSVIDRSAVALRPRVWARGEWRLARRIATPDTEARWQGGLALMLLDQVLLRFPPASERLRTLTLEATARVLGPVAAYIPGEREQWEELRQEVAAKAYDFSPASHTAQQAEAEQMLTDYEPPIAASSLFFGVELAAITQSKSAPSKVRLPVEGEGGTPFAQVVGDRLGGDEEATREVLAYLQAWSFVQDELGRPPTRSEFADHWHYDLAQVRREEELFSLAFPEESTPQRLVSLLDEGLPKSGQLVQMIAVPVVDRAEVTVREAPATGQRWRRQDGAVLTISSVEGSAVIGHLDEPHGERSLWASGKDKLKREFELVLPGDLWLVTFDVDVEPSQLLGLIARHDDLEMHRFRRPGDPRSGRNVLPFGTVQLQVLAANEKEARAKVVEAMAPRTDLGEVAVGVRPFRNDL
ncbi:MAG TPA: hypothetical protein VE127_06915 [Solirubrobacteraceae bacterium]|nr:hypothetical protein [Solirubrobacteraceae bacterium]